MDTPLPLGHGRFVSYQLCIQIPAYQAYPDSGDADPRPLPKPFMESVTVR
jgi:hypothetical protein